MKPMEIYTRTMKFVWLKLLVGAAGAVAAGLILGLFLLLGSAFGGSAMIVFGIIGGCLGIAAWMFISYYFGYMIKAGHVAVVAYALTNGTLPENQTAWATQMVKGRFATANVYYVLDRLVSGAVAQLQKAVNFVTDLLKNIPGMGLLQFFAEQYISIVLGSVDECCLGWCFLHPELGSFHASCDGVSIYFQNAKHLLKSGLKIAGIVVGITVAAAIPVILLSYALFHETKTAFAIALLVGLMLVMALKTAFLNSYAMIRMMASYLEVAPNTVLSFDLYEKLCGLSAKFRKLFNRAKEEGMRAV